MHDAGHLAQQAEFTRLGRAESVRLLAGVPVGRLVFTVNALPTVRLMNFALVDDLIVLRTAANATVARRVDGAIVVFEVDEIDAANSSGWSVTITGHAALVTDPGTIARYQAVPLRPWAPGVRDRFATVSTELVEGQRVRQSPATHDEQVTDHATASASTLKIGSPTRTRRVDGHGIYAG